MRSAVKKLWVKALRSDNYKQTRGTLKDNKGFCCLGVLCDVHQNEMKKMGRSYPEWSFGAYGNAAGHLSARVRRWAGLGSVDPRVKVLKKKGTFPLSDCNDRLKMSFKQIANAIEKSL